MIYNYDYYIFFWTKNHPLSNFYPSIFKDENGIIYNSMEQYFHYMKALMFDDKAMALQILASDNPTSQKRYGKQVRNYNEEVWSCNRFRIMKEGLVLKFSQDEDLKEYLLNTKDKILVEASPYDSIWGIGLNEYTARQTPELKWKGQNLMGKVLMEVRHQLVQEQVQKEQQIIIKQQKIKN